MTSSENGTNHNATIALRLALQPRETASLVVGILHMIIFFLGVATCVLWLQQIRLRIRIFGFWGVNKSLFLVTSMHFLGTLGEISYFGLLPGGFKRSGGVVGNPLYSSDQHGYLNSAPTLWCSFTSYLLYFYLNSILLMLAMIIHDTYVIAKRPAKASLSRLSSLMRVDGGCWKQTFAIITRNPVGATVSLVPFMSVILQATMSDQGPMGAYCGIRCAEKGIDDIYTSLNTCWVRLPAFFANCIIIGPFTIFTALRLMLHIRKVSTDGKRASTTAENSQGESKAKPSKKRTASQKMRGRMIWFSIALAFMTISAGILRISSSLFPNPNVEGKVGLTDYVSLLIMPATIYTFSLELWLGVFGCSSHIEDQRKRLLQKNPRNSRLLMSTQNTSSAYNDQRRSDLSTVPVPPLAENAKVNTSVAKEGNLYVVAGNTN